MQSVAKFGTNAYLVSGSAEDLIQVLPDTLHVHGRIAHEQVWDYVLQCKTSSSRVSDAIFIWATFLKGELRPEISLLHMKVLTLIKAKSNVFL